MPWWPRSVAVLVLLSACAFEPDGAVPLATADRYREWWARTEACSGRTGDFDAIQWYVVRGRDFACPTGRCVGRWEPNHRIYLAEAWVQSELVVRHEMLHALLGRAGHPAPPFGQGCPLTWETWRGDAARVADPGQAVLHID